MVRMCGYLRITRGSWTYDHSSQSAKSGTPKCVSETQNLVSLWMNVIGTFWRETTRESSVTLFDSKHLFSKGNIFLWRNIKGNGTNLGSIATIVVGIPYYRHLWGKQNFFKTIKIHSKIHSILDYSNSKIKQAPVRILRYLIDFKKLKIELLQKKLCTKWYGWWHLWIKKVTQQLELCIVDLQTATGRKTNGLGTH